MFNFRHERIDPDPPANRLTNCLTTDLTGNGRPDVLVCAMGADLDLGFPGGRIVKSLYTRRESNAFWYENPGWERHTITPEHGLHFGVGATLFDVNGDSRIDLVVGQAYGKHDVYWYEQPPDPRERWTQHLVCDRFEKYHDLTVADIDDDGRPELIGLSQNSETIFYYDIPDDPTKGPWPDSHLTIVDEGIRLEGVAVTDIDNDGRTELVAGPNIYHRPSNGTDWSRQPIGSDWDDTRVAVADLDSDGTQEIVLAEGDSPQYGTHPGRLAWCGSPDWEPIFLKENLFCPHTLQLADFTDNGYPDILIAEMGLGQHDTPKIILFENRGGMEFDEHILATGVETHEAKVVDLTGSGTLDIVGKSYEPDPHVDVWYNEAS